MTDTGCLAANVFDAALDRIRFVFDHCDDVIVSMSGGKDSTVVYNLAKQVARERGRLPLKEWMATETYVRTVMSDRISAETRIFFADKIEERLKFEAAMPGAAAEG